MAEGYTGEQAVIAAAAKKKARQKRVIAFAVLAGALAVAVLAWVFVWQPMQLYRQVMADVENGNYKAAITALETRADTEEKAQLYLAYAQAAKALAGNDLDTAEAALDRFADYEPLQAQYAQMTAAYDQMLFDAFFAAIQGGGNNAKKYWDKSKTTGGFTKEQCYQAAQWIVAESHADSKDQLEEYHGWVNTLLAGQEQTAEAAALLEQSDLQYAEKIIAASDTAADMDESSYQALKEVLSKYDSEPAQQMRAEWDALWEKEQKYQAAHAILTSQSRDADYGAAKQMFEELGDYRDAPACAEDAQELADHAKFLGLYREIEYIMTNYAADGSVFDQTILTGEEMREPFASIYYSSMKHCIVYEYSLEAPSAEILAAWSSGYRGAELVLNGDRFDFLYESDYLGKGRLDGDYIYIVDEFDLDLPDYPVKHTFAKRTLKRIA